MTLTISILTVIALFVWVYLAFFHGGFWRADQRIEDAPMSPPAAWPEIVAVVPARNEADVVGQTVISLLAQDYPRAFPIVLVDDGSRDGTADAARAAAANAPERLTIVTGSPMPSGWVGKVWAMAQGVAEADRIAIGARYILFCDADIAHEPTNLSRLTARAEKFGLDLASVMVMLVVERAWERLLIPPFIFFFQMLYPFAHVNKGRRKAAAGGCMLVRRSALAAAGGLETIRGSLIDDCALARSIGSAGGKLWLGLSLKTRSTRPYGGFAGVWKMVSRSAYTQLNYSPFLLVGTVLSMLLVYVIPLFALVYGVFMLNMTVALAGALSLALMIGIYVPTVRLYRQPILATLFLPVAAALYTAMTVDSAWRHWRGVGGGWKGRIYSR